MSVCTSRLLWFIFFPSRLRLQVLRHIEIYARRLLQARLSIFLIICLDVAILTNSSFKPQNMYLSLSIYKWKWENYNILRISHVLHAISAFFFLEICINQSINLKSLTEPWKHIRKQQKKNLHNYYTTHTIGITHNYTLQIIKINTKQKGSIREEKEDQKHKQCCLVNLWPNKAP